MKKEKMNLQENNGWIVVRSGKNKGKEIIRIINLGMGQSCNKKKHKEDARVIGDGKNYRKITKPLHRGK